MKIGYLLNARSRLNVSSRGVGAARFFGVGVSRQGISAGPRSAANLLEFTGAALTFELRCIAQVPKKMRLPINNSQFLLTNIADGERHETAWKDLSSVRNEDEPLAIIQDARRPPDHVVDLLVAALLWDKKRCCTQFSSGGLLLQNKAPIMLRLRSLDVDPAVSKRLKIFAKTC